MNSFRCPNTTLKCLNVGTPKKNINFPFGTNGKLMVFRFLNTTLKCLNIGTCKKILIFHLGQMEN